MLKEERVLVALLMVLLLLEACSSIEQQHDYIPVKLNIIQKFNIDFIPQKCVFSYPERTAFIMEGNNIHIFKNGRRINTIGGLGFDHSNFNKLSDIAIAPDGNLLALDSFQKKIKKFDKDGKWITEFELVNFVGPTLFEITSNETFYIYDDNRKEIVTTRTFEENDFYSFGKFQLVNPRSLNLAKNIVLVYDLVEAKTIVFDRLGQFQEELDGKVQFDRRQKYKLEKYFFQHLTSSKKFAVTSFQWLDFLIDNGFLILLSNHEIWICTIDYEIK
ncbi:MAG: hypothetical protein ISS80_02320 [Candidatus Cloacimonetes bacterium]|nr:hypothetical protein [Candidatus Cloacimonadota bacterium]